MVRYRIEDINEWNNVNHVELHDNGRITCRLCNAGPMTEGSAHSHFNGQSHEKKYSFMINQLDYVIEGRNGHFTCELCNIGPMPEGSILSHLTGRNHRNRSNSSYADELRSEMLSNLKKQNYKAIDAKDLLPRINQLGFSTWKHHVQSLLFTFITQTTSTNHEIAEQYLEKYERMEYTSLLELAILKHKVCTNVAFLSMQEVYDYKALENGFDPQAFMRSQRMTCGSNVIIPLVMEYLWE